MKLLPWTWLVAGAVCACTSNITVVETNPENTGGSGGGVVMPPTGGSRPEGPGEPPPPPPNGAMPEAGAVSFAMSRALYGSTDRDGNPSPNAWRSYGYNLDHLATQAGSEEHCRPAAGASPAVMDDGDNGIDNAWGKSLVPLWASLQNDFEVLANEAVADGRATIVIGATGVGDQSNYLDIFVRAFHGAPLTSAPAWDGTGTWPVSADSLSSPNDIATARWKFEEGYVVNDVLVTAPAGTFELLLPLGGFQSPLRVPIDHAILSLRMSPDRATGSDGVIAGVIPTEALAAAVLMAAAEFSTEFCSGPTIEAILTQIRQASDILADGTQDPSRTCDGVSVGIGFDAVRFAINSVGAAVATPVDPCE